MSKDRNEPASRPLRVIHVGMGGWGRSWAEEMLKHPELLETVAYVDVSPEMLAQLRTELRVGKELCFPTLEAALAATDAEAALVTTAAPGHAPVAIEALEAGLHVLVEKPLATTMADAIRVVDAAKRAKRTVMVSQNYRFFPAAQAVATLLRKGTLGTVGAVRVDFRKYDNAADPKTHRHYLLPDPLLLDMSIHHFDLMRYVLGQEATRIFTVSRDPVWSHYVGVASARATIEFDGGTLVDYSGSWVSTAPSTPWAGEWVIECQEGSISWTARSDWTDAGDAVVVHPVGGDPRPLELPTLDYVDRAGAMYEFARSLREGRAPLTSAEANLGTLALSLGAIESAETGGPLLLIDPTEGADIARSLRVADETQ